VDVKAGPVTKAEAEWVASQRKWAGGWRILMLRAVPLAYLVFVASDIDKFSHGTARTWAYVVLGTFAVCWLLAPALIPRMPSWQFWAVGATLVALLVVESPFARASAFVLGVFITVLLVAGLRGRAIPAIMVLAVAALVVPVLVPSWHDSLAASFDDVTPIAIPIAGLVTFFYLQVVQGNEALAEARVELARLAAENERMRIARDLHDLLGHSLTTITVKAGLARRLGDADPGRAQQEMAEVEALARQSLSDVRAAVSNYRDVTLTGELAAGRELLRAAGISADLPRAVDVVDPSHQELFGWVVREGLTNIVRHARASSCTVRLYGAAVEILDDGVGSAAPPGNGLSGLRERVAAAGGVVDAGPVEPRGWRLRVSLAAAGGA
jgi:two-component system, NarL family, sensor histidine kinase DesK